MVKLKNYSIFFEVGFLERTEEFFTVTISNENQFKVFL